MSRASSRKAGQNIRELAIRRRIKAITSFASAGLVIFVPFMVTNTVNDFLRRIALSNQSLQQPALNVPPVIYLLLLFVAAGLVANGIYLWKRANHADQGAKGEEDVAQEMLQLAATGWQIEYGIRLGNRLGDADIVCISPQQKAYVIDVKSHRGEVITDGKNLCRRMGSATYPFEKDFLKQAVKQAMQVKQQKSLQFVTPIVAFSAAKVSVPVGKLQNVYVVEKARLVGLLKQLG